MTNEHTPGPWSIHTESEHPCPRIDGPNGRGVASATQRDPHPTLGMGITTQEAMANSRLIASAPDLLAALQLVAGEVTDYVRPTSADSHLPTDIVAVVHAAIAKATGGQL